MVNHLSFVEPTEGNPNTPFSLSSGETIKTELFGLYKGTDFPKEYQLFHGTSSANESSIEREGLIPNKTLITREDLIKVLNLFNYISWYGLTGASRAILEPFSINHDYNHAGVKPIYLAETCLRASLYASKDFAGGEVSRTLRKCFNELWQFVDNPKVQEDHMKKLKKENDYCKKNGFFFDEKTLDFSVDSLRQNLVELEYLQKMVEADYNNFNQGLIYCIKLKNPDLQDLEFHTRMGVKSFKGIDLGNIISKTYVPLNYVRKFID